MAHVNTQVRNEVKSRLQALGVFNSVSSNRGSGLEDADLPAAVVQTLDDATEDASKGYASSEPYEQREIQLFVVLAVRGDADGVDDAVDALRAQVEAAVIDDNQLGGIAQEIEHIHASLEVGEEVDGERWYVFLTLEWRVEVWTRRGDPETLA